MGWGLERLALPSAEILSVCFQYTSIRSLFALKVARLPGFIPLIESTESRRFCKRSLREPDSQVLDEAVRS